MTISHQIVVSRFGGVQALQRHDDLTKNVIISFRKIVITSEKQAMALLALGYDVFEIVVSVHWAYFHRGAPTWAALAGPPTQVIAAQDWFEKKNLYRNKGK